MVSLLGNICGSRLYPGQTVESSVAEDVLKLVVVNRYSDQKPQLVCRIAKGAIASTVAQ